MTGVQTVAIERRSLDPAASAVILRPQEDDTDI